MSASILGFQNNWSKTCLFLKKMIGSMGGVVGMSVISTFFEIIVRIFHDDHNPPHFHVEYSGYNAIIEIKTAKLIQGFLPPRALKFALEWRKLHVQELNKAWVEAQKGRIPKRISPLE